MTESQNRFLALRDEMISHREKLIDLNMFVDLDESEGDMQAEISEAAMLFLAGKIMFLEFERIVTMSVEGQIQTLHELIRQEQEEEVEA